MISIVVVYHSASGRTRTLAEAVARGATAATRTGDTTVTAHVVSVDEAQRSQALLAAADAIVFGSPTYMGSASAQFKAFMDATSAIWALQGWRDKLAAGFTHSAALSGDKLGTLTQLAVFAAQHGMIWVGLGLPPTYLTTADPDDDTNRLGSHLGAMAQSRPGGGALPPGDVKTAEHLGRRVTEAALRWARGKHGAKEPRTTNAPERHPATQGWAFPPLDRAPLPDGIERTNLRELAARPDRFEHHLMICATIDGVQLEIATASEPLYFSHINLSDEWALALPTGDELVDRFPLRTFLSDAKTGADVGRYNHRIGDLVLHPEGYLHWPGRLRPPYEPFEIPPGMRRCGLSLVYCASKPTPATWCPRTPDRQEDVKAYVTPAPPMALASMRGPPGVVARIGRTSLSLVELPDEIGAPHGAWVVVLEAEAGGLHAPCDLLRVPEGKTLPGKGIVRALVLASEEAAPDPVPPIWATLPAEPFLPRHADAAGDEGVAGSAGALPLTITSPTGSMVVEETSPAVVSIAVGDKKTEAPRHWLARMLHRVALHGLRVGYAETYGGFFIDDRGDDVLIGVRDAPPLALDRAEAARTIERMYRAVAPPGYRERMT